MPLLKEIKDSFLHVLFPHVCTGCGNDIINDVNELCMRCIDAMPETNFEKYTDNPVEKLFGEGCHLQVLLHNFILQKNH